VTPTELFVPLDKLEPHEPIGDKTGVDGTKGRFL
jgi:hypothetical protein